VKRGETKQGRGKTEEGGGGTEARFGTDRCQARTVIQKQGRGKTGNKTAMDQGAHVRVDTKGPGKGSGKNENWEFGATKSGQEKRTASHTNQQT